jgi:hypothetical protein
VFFYECRGQVADGFIDRDHVEVVLMEKFANATQFHAGACALEQLHDRDDGNSRRGVFLEEPSGPRIAEQEPDQYVRVKDHGNGCF